MTDDGFEAYIDPKDLAEFHIAMDNLDPDKVLASEWRNLLVPMKRELRDYPPMLPNQKYKRTMNLRRNWQYAVLSPRAAQMENLAKYAGWVQGVEQAGIHEGRWTKAIPLAEKHLEAWVKKLAEKIGRVWTK